MNEMPVRFAANLYGRVSFHRKIGGIHWFAFGRVRIGVCLVRRKPCCAPRDETLVRSTPNPAEMDTITGPGKDKYRVVPIRMPKTGMFPWPPETK